MSERSAAAIQFDFIFARVRLAPHTTALLPVVRKLHQTRHLFVKTQIESIMPMFTSDTDFVVPLKPAPRRIEASEKPANAGSFFAALPDPLESRGVPASALHD